MGRKDNLDNRRKAKYLYWEHIDNDKFFPDYMKDEAKKLVQSHLDTLNKLLSLMFLTHARCYQHHSELDKSGKPKYDKFEKKTKKIPVCKN